MFGAVCVMMLAVIRFPQPWAYQQVPQGLTTVALLLAGATHAVVLRAPFPRVVARAPLRSTVRAAEERPSNTDATEGVAAEWVEAKEAEALRKAWAAAPEGMGGTAMAPLRQPPS